MRARPALALLASMMAALASPAAAQTGERWIGTWATSPHAVSPAPAAEQSMRMIVRTTIGGDRVRIRLANVQGSGDVTFGAATVAVRERDADVRPGVVALSFGGAPSVTVHAGTEVLSDPAPMAVPAGRDLAVSFYVRGAAAKVTAHTGARKTSWLTPAGAGDHTTDTSGAAYSQSTTSWLFLDEVLVESPAAGAIVGLGSSSVDGTGTTTDADDRWSDVMARRLQQRPACSQYGYLNEGVDADTFDVMLARIQRDVLPRAGVRYVILYAGSGNDMRVSPSRDRRAPHRFTTRGRLILPRGITASRACAGGRVSVSVKAGRNTISTRRARVRSDCSFASRVSFAGARRFGRHHRLGVTVRFLGTQRLRRVTAQPRHVRV